MSGSSENNRSRSAAHLIFSPHANEAGCAPCIEHNACSSEPNSFRINKSDGHLMSSIRCWDAKLLGVPGGKYPVVWPHAKLCQDGLGILHLPTKGIQHSPLHNQPVSEDP